jgi:tripeptidyl-peptidase I
MGPLKAPVQDTLFPSIPSTFMAPAAATLPPNLQTCGRNMTPACYRYLYDIPDKVDAVAGNSLGLFEQGSYFLQSDLNLFYSVSAPNVPNGTAPIPALIDGARYGALPTDGEEVTGEADIDIDIGQSLIYPQTITLYQVDDQLYEPAEVATTNVFNTFLDALDGSYCNYSAYGVTGDTPPYDAVYPDTRPGGYNGTRQCGTLKLTPVVSASYGQAEIDLPVNYNKRQCDEFMKLGLQGHSLLFSSGDYGVGSFPGDPSANGCLGPKATIFNPQYPSGCPYITSVGATMLYPDQTVDMPESVMHVNLSQSAQNFTSSGGFSNYYAPPAYQQAALNTYFAEHKPPYPAYARYAPDINFNTTCGLYNRIGRGYPDVSANGAYLLAPASGSFYHWFGASLSSPLFASVLTMVSAACCVAQIAGKEAEKLICARLADQREPREDR